MSEALLAEHLAAENAHDLDRIMATYAPDPLIVLNGQRIEGAAAIAKFHQGFGFGAGAASFSDVNVAERHRHRAPDGTVVIEQTLNGVHTGDWQGLQPTRRPFAVDVCTVYSFAPSGKLASERVYFDLSWLRRQLTK